MAHSVNVRTIAETYFEGGDLQSGFSALERMQEGLKGHLLVQGAYDARYKAEVLVKLNTVVDGVELTVQGRVDGLMLDGETCAVEEIKTTSQSPAQIAENDYPVHWAQAEIYAHILCETHALGSCTVRLVYADLVGERVQYERVCSAARLSDLFYTYASVYAARVKREDEWLDQSLPSVKQSLFPFESFRAGQREFAEAAYRAIRNRTKLLAQAPTGIGKTAAALFPAVKALGEGLTDIVFYLTARTTGRKAAESALALMRCKGLKLRSVSVVAQRKLCPTPLISCDPELCPRARGHFDRQKRAVEESWLESAMDEGYIRELAEKHRVCPFELTLALCETAQLVICDYNYVFDPKVRLKRFFDRSGRYTLLIDEAHNLPERAREMYSAEIDGDALKTLMNTVGRAEGKTSALYAGLKGYLSALGKTKEYSLDGSLPLPVISAAKSFIDEAKPYLGLARGYGEALREEYFRAMSFVRTSDLFDETGYRALRIPSEEDKKPYGRLRLWCFDPTPLLTKVMKRMRGCVMFSATLSPIEHYGRLLGADGAAGDTLLDLPSPFPRENLLSAAISIPTRYSAREESADKVAQALKALASSRTGNYLACFPSHAYMSLVARTFLSIAGDVDVLIQRRDMSEREREEFLSRFTPAPGRSLLAFVAMGGVFSEGIDLPGDRLIGAAIVGVGMPQICYERNALADLYNDDDGEGGFETAYLYPGIGKCLQAAGRVIRSEKDVGAVLFIDERYALPEYRKLLPPHLKPLKLREEKIGEALEMFWERHEQ